MSRGRRCLRLPGTVCRGAVRTQRGEAQAMLHLVKHISAALWLAPSHEQCPWATWAGVRTFACVCTTWPLWTRRLYPYPHHLKQTRRFLKALLFCYKHGCTLRPAMLCTRRPAPQLSPAMLSIPPQGTTPAASRTPHRTKPALHHRVEICKSLKTPCRIPCLVQYRVRTCACCACANVFLCKHADGHSNFEARDRARDCTKRGKRHSIL